MYKSITFYKKSRGPSGPRLLVYTLRREVTRIFILAIFIIQPASSLSSSVLSLQNSASSSPRVKTTAKTYIEEGGGESIIGIVITHWNVWICLPSSSHNGRQSRFCIHRPHRLAQLAASDLKYQPKRNEMGRNPPPILFKKIDKKGALKRYFLCKEASPTKIRL